MSGNQTVSLTEEDRKRIKEVEGNMKELNKEYSKLTNKMVSVEFQKVTSGKKWPKEKIGKFKVEVVRKDSLFGRDVETDKTRTLWFIEILNLAPLKK